MSAEASDEAGGGGVADTFYAHYLTFREGHPAAREIIVTIQLTTGDTFDFNGLRVDRAAGPPDWVMIRGVAEGPAAAVVVHEGSIFLVEFAADPPRDRKFGFT